jgi:hypothetical protein
MKFTFPIIVLMGLAALFMGCSGKEEPAWPAMHNADASLTETKTLIGKPVALVVRAHHAAEDKVLPPLLDDGDRIVSRRISETTSTQKNPDSSLTVWHYEVTSYELGAHAVATGGVRIVTGESTITAALPELVLTVERSLPEGEIAEVAPLRDLKTERATLPPAVKKLLWFCWRRVCCMPWRRP